MERELRVQELSENPVRLQVPFNTLVVIEKRGREEARRLRGLAKV